MSNIHGMGNINRGGSGNPGGDNQFPMMGRPSDDGGNPREEGFCKFLKNFCCPTFVFTSVIFFVSCADLIIYIATLCFGIEMNPNDLLAPKAKVLDMFGMKNPAKMQNGQVWRFITYAFLHANLVHVVVNLFSQIIIGSFIEHMIGSLKTSGLYLLSAIGGAIFSCLVSNSNGVGASVSIYGMLGAYLGYTLMNWHALDRIMGPMNKFCNLLFIGFIVIMNIAYGFSNPMIDNWGHIGGLIFGFFLIFVLHSPNEPDDGLGCKHSIWFWVSLSFTLTFSIVGLVCFYTVRKV